MKDNLDFSTEMPHHEDESAVLNISITNYEDGARMTIKNDDGQRVTITREELSTLLEIMLRYHDAIQIMKGEKP